MSRAPEDDSGRWSSKCPDLEGKHFSEQTIKLIRRTYNRFQFDPNLRNHLNATRTSMPPQRPSNAAFDPISNLYIAPPLPQNTSPAPKIRPSEVQIRQSEAFGTGNNRETCEVDVDLDFNADLGMKLSDLNLSTEDERTEAEQCVESEESGEDSQQDVHEEEKEESEEMRATWKTVAEQLSLSPEFLAQSVARREEETIPNDDLDSVKDLVESHFKQLQEYYKDDS